MNSMQLCLCMEHASVRMQGRVVWEVEMAAASEEVTFRRIGRHRDQSRNSTHEVGDGGKPWCIDQATSVAATAEQREVDSAGAGRARESQRKKLDMAGVGQAAGTYTLARKKGGGRKGGHGGRWLGRRHVHPRAQGRWRKKILDTAGGHGYVHPRAQERWRKKIGHGGRWLGRGRSGERKFGHGGRWPGRGYVHPRAQERRREKIGHGERWPGRGYVHPRAQERRRKKKVDTAGVGQAAGEAAEENLDTAGVGQAAERRRKKKGDTAGIGQAAGTYTLARKRGGGRKSGHGGHRPGRRHMAEVELQRKARSRRNVQELDHSPRRTRTETTKATSRRRVEVRIRVREEVEYYDEDIDVVIAAYSAHGWDNKKWYSHLLRGTSPHHTTLPKAAESRENQCRMNGRIIADARAAWERGRTRA
ncbi:hypothetical protein C8J57DRAFT_1257586 [Mycena rebaudengoi]|nr:hypothetical protein C8J57DRAFT_1257586 [Mycena rebaudengoi]